MHVRAWNIAALSGPAQQRCNWLSEGSKQDCGHVEGSGRLTFRNENESGQVAALGTPPCSLWYHCGCYFYLYFCGNGAGGESGKGDKNRLHAIPYLHYSHFGGRTSPWRLNMFLVWYRSSMFLPLIRQAQAFLVCVPESVYITHLQRWKWDSCRALLKGVGGDSVVWGFCRDFFLTSLN